MILSVHATFGAAVASLVPSHPVLGFVLGFTSHFVLDAIPHRDYDLISTETGPDKKLKLIDLIQKKFGLIRDIMVVSFDALIGLSLAFLFFFDPVHPWIFFIGAISSLIPDGLTFLYLLFKHKSLTSFFNFHVDRVHTKFILKLDQVTGVLFQFFTIGVLIVVIVLVRYFLFL
ncbi:MAG: hypothetical protein WCP24_03700 [bacterium]